MSATEIKLSIGIPTTGLVSMGFAYSLTGMISYTAANAVKTLPEASIQIKLDVVQSSNWITNREKLCRHAVDNDMTHLLFLDDDMVFDPQVLEIMLGRRQSIVCTNYLMKKEEPEFVAVSLDGKSREKTTEKSTGIQPIAYSGFGVSLFDVEVFKKVPQPWFAPEFVPERSEYTTEDNPFYRKAREAGFTVYLDHDASKLVSHVGTRAWYWKDANG
jgi:hypothetical protein